MNFQSAAYLLESNDPREVIKGLNFISIKSFDQTVVDNNITNPNHLESNPQLVLSLGSLLDATNPLFDQQPNEPTEYAIYLNKISTLEWSDISIKNDLFDNRLEVISNRLLN